MKTKNTDIITQNRIFIWIALITGLVLLVPLVAMQFTYDVVWTPMDFSTMGALLFGIGSLFVLAARRTQKLSRRIAIGIAFAVVFFYLWVELAVGIFTNWGS
jgi:hypothetical protein